MTLQSSGAISISQINAEFGRGNNLNAYRGTTWYTDAGGSGTFSSGAISMSDFYGKRATSPTFSFTISSNQTNADLRTLAINAGWNQSSAVVATIAGGVYISSNSTGTPGLTINGSFPGGVSLVNNGYILGMGGAGGHGGGDYRYGPGYSNYGQPGGAGGTALSASVGVTIQNNGTIGGGGGGGGGGSAAGGTNGVSMSAGGGGGGGRTGLTSSTGGTGGYAAGGWPSARASSGGSGTSSGPGAGGAGNQNGSTKDGTFSTGGTGGTGGGWGAGGAGGGATGYHGPGAGGAGGAAVSGNGYISWTATGTRYGAIT